MFIYTPPERDRKVRTTQGRPMTRRVDETIEHITRNWIPVNPRILKEVQDKIGSGEYRNEPKLLMEDLKRDPGLFMHAARNLKQHVEDVRAGLEPLGALAALEEEKLQKIFDVSEKNISEHRFKDMRQTQALRLQHSIISSRAAEKLALKASVPAELSLSSAMFRQLGHNLMAWNYPDIYTRALSKQRQQKSEINIEMKKYLGVSPLQISAKMATEWNMAPEIRSAVTPPDPDREKIIKKVEADSGDSMTLERVCQLAELFAQANDPQHYPEAGEKWKAAEARYPHVIETSFYRSLETPVLEIIGICSEILPRDIQPAYFEKKQVPGELNEYGRRLLEANTYVKRCSNEVRGMFEGIYKLIRTSDGSMNAIKFLVDFIVPESGFRRGCLYVADAGSFMLRPMLRAGDLPLTSYSPIRPGEISPVGSSVGSDIPLQQEGKGIDGTNVRLIAGSLGGPLKRPAVLYLEIDDEHAANSDTPPMTSFNAIRQCMLDSLGKMIKD